MSDYSMSKRTRPMSFGWLKTISLATFVFAKMTRPTTLNASSSSFSCKIAFVYSKLKSVKIMAGVDYSMSKQDLT